MSAEKFVKAFDLPDGAQIVRHPVTGKWELLRSHGMKSQVSDFQQRLIDAAILAGINYGKVNK